jgi:hypothetical protein
LESEAVLALLSVDAAQVEFLPSAALDLENEQNPLPHRANKVRLWLNALNREAVGDEILDKRTRELMALGFKSFDAAHIASAELLGAAAMCTCDDRLLAAARRHAPLLNVRILNPIDLVKEIL